MKTQCTISKLTYLVQSFNGVSITPDDLTSAYLHTLTLLVEGKEVKWSGGDLDILIDLVYSDCINYEQLGEWP